MAEEFVLRRASEATGRRVGAATGVSSFLLLYAYFACAQIDDDDGLHQIVSAAAQQQTQTAMLGARIALIGGFETQCVDRVSSANGRFAGGLHLEAIDLRSDLLAYLLIFDCELPGFRDVGLRHWNLVALELGNFGDLLAGEVHKGASAYLTLVAKEDNFSEAM